MTLPPAAVAAAAVAGVAAVAGAGVAAAPAAHASTPPGKALVLLQGGTTAPETTALQAAGWTVDQATPAAWAADSAATFKSYAVLVIGDPSTTSSCSTSIPTTATLGTTWQSAVSGNVAVLGTAPAAAGTTAATALITASAAYAGAGYTGSAGTGLYVSLNCEYKTAAAGTAVPLLNGVEGTGTAGGLTVRGSLSCSDPGTVNKWEATTAGTFGAINNNSLSTGAWTSTGCPVQEAFSSWPAMYTPVAIDAAADATPANSTTSNGTQGQPYALLGHPVTTATAALAPGTGGEVPPQSAATGSNPAAPGVTQATAGDPVNTENGDFTQSADDLAIPGYGPALDFTRTYDAQAAQRQTVAGTPGPLGYGWTDNWATSLTLQRPVPGDIYTVSPTGVFPFEPVDMVSDAAGDVLYVDASENDVVEVAAATHSQFGISMTAGHAYVVAGSPSGTSGSSGDGGPATSALLNTPWGLALDGSGNLFIADQGNNRVQEVPAASGTQFGISVTANDMYTVAGSATGASGSSGDGGPATSALLNTPDKVRVDHAGNLYITDGQNFRVQEVPVATGTQRGQSMTAGDMYTITGQAGINAYSGDGGPATSARFVSPAGLALDAAGDIYVSDDYTDVVREVPAAAGTQWGRAMTANDVYTIAGNSSVAGTGGSSGDGGPATSALLNGPQGLGVDAAGDLYIGDTFNNRLQEVPVASGTQWGQSMTAGDMYTVIGSSMVQGDTGDGGPAAAAELSWPAPVAFDPSGNMLIPDAIDSEIREVFATTSQLFSTSPAGTGITVNQADGSQVTFYPKSGGNCTAPYTAAAGSGYCTLPQNVNATLTYNSGAGTYTYTPAPGTSYTYNSTTGALKSVADTAGNTLTLTSGSPAPGSGHCPATATSCTTITAASGRTLVLGYNSAGSVTSATDPLARRWVYAYTGSQLTTVTDPLTNVTTYTYGAGSTGNPQLANDLLTMTAPNGQAGGSAAGKKTVNVYDAQGRVTTQTDPMGFQTTFNYCASTAAGNCMNPATGTGLVTVSDPDGNSTVYDYQQGTLAATSTFTGSTLTSETDQQPNTTNGTLLAGLSADGNGNITTDTYSAAGNLTQENAPAATGTATTTYTYATTAAATADLANCASTAAATATCQAASPPAPVAPGGTITPPSAAPPVGTTYTLYDTDGNQLYSTTGVYQPGASTASYSQTTYQLFKGNSVTLSGTTTNCATVPPSQSLPCAKINADGKVTQLAYDTAGDLTSSATPDGNGTEVATTTYAYNGDGEQTSMVAPDGNLTGANIGNYTTVTAYNNDDQKTTVTQAGGTGATATPRVTTYGYDPDGNQTTVKDARTYTTTTTYNADDKATLVTDPDSHTVLTCYDGVGHVAQTVPAVGVAAGSLTPASCPAAYPAGYSTRLATDATVTTFNADGKQLKQTTPAPAGQTGYETTTYAYDGNGNPTTATAPAESNGVASVVTVDSYNPDGTIASETIGYGSSTAATTSYCYDPHGDTTAVVMADGNTSGSAPCETSSPWVVDSGAYPNQASYQTTYKYDSAGELVSTTTPATTAAPSGATTNVTYDPAGNKLTSQDPNAVTTTWTYTPLNLAATVTYSGSSAHAVTYGYDADGSRTSMSDATGSSSSVYDPFGEMTSTTNGAGQVTGYGYNPDGQPTALTYPLPAAATWATTATVTKTYDNADLLTAITDFNGHQITVGNTADGQPTSDALGSTGDTITTVYDATDASSSISLVNGSSTLQSFTYSDAPSGDILSETDIPASAQSPATYTYDGQGRIASMTPGTGTSRSYAFDPSSNLTALPTGATGAYDKAGELTSSTLASITTGYVYDHDGERLTANQGASAVASATWNGADRLASYSDTAANMTTAAYDGDGLRQSTTITPAGGTALAQGYTWDSRGDLPQVLMDGTNAYVYASDTAPAEQINLVTGALTYLVRDALGSVRGVVSNTGALAATTSYDAWGSPTASGGLTGTTPFGYAGGYTDADGLVYLLARYYDPSTGQFISGDPLTSSTLQPYAYASGSPVNAADPSGKAAMYEVPLNRKCADHSCAWGRRNCQRPQNWCNANVWMTFTGSAGKSHFPELVWNLWINAWPVAAGQYSHGEVGTYPFHFQWGAPTRTNVRGQYKCYGFFTCHLGPTDRIEVLFGGVAVTPSRRSAYYVGIAAWLQSVPSTLGGGRSPVALLNAVIPVQNGIQWWSIIHSMT
jgi:RHS repeat-associated protein